MPALCEPGQSAQTPQKEKIIGVLCSLQLAELVDERDSNMALQVRISQFIKPPIFCNVATAHGGVGTRMEHLEQAYVCPDPVPFVEDERSEDVDVGFERCREWDVIEHAEPQRKERGGSL